MRESDGIGDVKPGMKEATLEIQAISQIIHPSRVLTSYLGLRSLDPNKLTAVHCKSGYRSAIACSLLEAHGFTRVMNVLGGFDAWSQLHSVGSKSG